MSADSDLYRLRLNLRETEELIAIFVLRNRKYATHKVKSRSSKVWVGPR